MIKLGTSDLSKAYVGSSEVSKMYLGSKLVYSSGPAPLPYDAEVEYLEIEGLNSMYSGFINTEIKAKSTITFRIKFELLNNTVYNMIFGARESMSSKRLDFGNGVNSGTYWSFGNKVSAKQGLLNVGTYTFSNENIPTTLKVSGTLSRTYTASGGSFTSENNIYLFALNNNGTPSQGSYLRGFGAKIYDDGVLVRDYIPVRKNDIGYYYDKVSGRLFASANSNTFIIGPDV